MGEKVELPQCRMSSTSDLTPGKVISLKKSFYWFNPSFVNKDMDHCWYILLLLILAVLNMHELKSQIIP